MESKEFISSKGRIFRAMMGLEIHLQIKTQRKLFSPGPSSIFGAEPNSCVSFVDAGFPGMLPTLNEGCVKKAIMMGLGLGGMINPVSVMERKHYFYRDLPDGYQRSQNRYPLVENGKYILKSGKEIRIQRLHIEQDAGKSIYDEKTSTCLVDLNRAGVGLMEIVSEPDFETPEEVVEYVKSLRNLARYLDTSDGDMEKGQLRVDANISVSLPGDPAGRRVELKNMNSLRFLNQALIYEIQRQIECIEAGEMVHQETRSFDPVKGTTARLRLKENSDDYRYFPDPDMPDLRLSEEYILAIAQTMPELPSQKKDRFIRDLALSEYDASILSDCYEVSVFFDQCIGSLKRPEPQSYKWVANWIVGNLFALLPDKEAIVSCPITPGNLAQLIHCLQEGSLSSPLAKEVFQLMWDTGKDPLHIMKERGLVQVLDIDTIQGWIDEVLQDSPQQLEQYLGGKEKMLTYFVGQTMKKAQGKANPPMIQELLLKTFEEKKKSV